MPSLSKSKSAPEITFIGIDPGQKGGIAKIYPDKVEVFTMPDTQRDVWELVTNTRSEYIQAVIEHVTTSPQMGVVSAGVFMFGYGGLRMALTAAQIPHEPIRPQVWQKALMIPPRKKGMSDREQKNKLRAKAQQLFPKLPLWSQPGSIGLQLAVSDALLIAYYARMRYSLGQDEGTDG